MLEKTGVSSRKMTISQFINVESRPRQRNTEIHARKAALAHLSRTSPTQMQVSVAQLPGGRLVKLDGHTRSYLWNTGELKPFSNLLDVTVYAVKNMAEVMELYEHFDAASQSKTCADQISGKLRELNWDPSTTFFQNCKFNQVLFTAWDTIYNHGKKAKWLKGDMLKEERYRLIEEFLPELKRIDGHLNVSYSSRGKINTGVVAAMIVTLRAVMRKKVGSPELYVEFWDNYLKGNGIKAGREKNAVQAYSDYVEEKSSRGDGRSTSDICEKGLGYFSGFCENKAYIRSISSIDFTPYIIKR